MSSEIIVMITALLSALLGASLPVAGKFIELKIKRKSDLKEKHEEVIRIILSDFLPEIDQALNSIEDYYEAVDDVKVDFNLARLYEINELYVNKIKNSSPLELIADLGELNFSIKSLNYLMILDVTEGIKFHYDEVYLEAKEYYNNLKLRINKTYL
ncbi:hypothetical protein QOZ98_000518 [Planomicrobium stackebrandtii]|uniref:Uncharacterized protein n=1 Tax=Planomicrobium stackebrandtii TaxID=253160 RepID=A0ABU0GQX8_9BACL|nr:hypothetical protein [Planomicrobium stackebrandtii]MDQ0427693.1 hypothetical protein [Planomicrobium stackebrandtii]